MYAVVKVVRRMNFKNTTSNSYSASLLVCQLSWQL